jgi:PIN like domain
MSTATSVGSGRFRAADVRYYVDADILGLGKLLGSLRLDVTYPGDPGAVIHKRRRPPCRVTSPRALDPEWIPIVSGQGLLILTRDSHIQNHTAEIEAVMSAKGRLVALSSEDAATTWGQLEVVMTQWRWLEQLRELPGPFVYSLSRTGQTKVA